MLSRFNFTAEHIFSVCGQRKIDPSIVEKSIFAFGLLEALIRVELPFVFKGGTSLMLLLKRPQRLSTDIDIIVTPGTNVDEYIRRAGEIFPFIKVYEDIRFAKNAIEKRHYQFLYSSPLSGKPLIILLDILFENHDYPVVEHKQISNEILLCEGQMLQVNVPDINGILGDKLTAFAPRTTGIPFGIGKEMEIIKQMFDCWCLLQEMDNFAIVKETYAKVVVRESLYRGAQWTMYDVLEDAIKSCLSIISRGTLYPEDYRYFLQGIRKISGHILREDFTGETAAYIACKVFFLCVCLYAGIDYHIPNSEAFRKEFVFRGSRAFNFVKKTNSESYGYVVEGMDILGEKAERFF